MTPQRSNAQEPHADSDLCAYCPHSKALHNLLLVVQKPLPAGIVLCPQPGCQCTATWAASVGGPSTPESRKAPIAAVKERLLADNQHELLQMLYVATQSMS